MPLNQQSPIPLYRQLADRIRDEIDNGVHAVATRIPSENELAQRYRIGRPTVRQATDLLVRQGKLERRRGSGTYVMPPTQSIDLFSLAGTSAALKHSELDVRLNLVNHPVIEPVPCNKKNSAISEHESVGHDEAFLKVERCASVDNAPVLFETLWISDELFPGLQNHNLENQSLSALVRDVYFLEPSSADQTFYVVSADKTQSAHLQTPIGTPHFARAQTTALRRL